MTSLQVLRQYYVLAKPRVIQLIVFCALIGMVLAVPGLPNAAQLGHMALACLGVWLVAGAVVAAMAVRPTGLVTVGVVTRGVLGVMVPGVVVPGVETVRGTWTAAVLFVRFALVVTALWAASGVGWVATPAVGLGAVGVCDVADRDGWAALVFTVAGVVPLVAVATGLVAVVRLGVRLGVPALEALESVEVAAGAADAVAGFSVITHPIPRATASAPTRPMLFAAPIAASFAKRGDCRAVRHG